MMNRIPDQAEKLRQLVEQENLRVQETFFTTLEEDIQDSTVENHKSISEENLPEPEQDTIHTIVDQNQSETVIPEFQPLREQSDDVTDKLSDTPHTALASESNEEVKTPAGVERDEAGELDTPDRLEQIPAQEQNINREHKPLIPRELKNSLKRNSSDQAVKIKPVTDDTSGSLLSSKRIPVGHTQVIAITGGKGGVGKSNITCNLAIAMAQMKKRVLILDADLSLANIDVLLGLTPRVNLAHVLRGEKKLEEVIVRGPAGIQLIPSGSGVEELSNLSMQQMEHLFDAFTNLHPMPDVLLIDTAAGIHANVLQFLKAADQTIIVTTPEPTAYTDAYALIKTLIRYDPGKEIGVLVNMAKDRHEAMEVIKLMFQMCRQFLQIMFNNLGYIPRDNEVLKSVRLQKPLLIHSPSSPAAKEIRNIAATILQVDRRKQHQGLRGFFHRLFSRSMNDLNSPQENSFPKT
ncbi:MAG: MinD/ParA family protein [bacterium]